MKKIYTLLLLASLSAFISTGCNQITEDPLVDAELAASHKMTELNQIIENHKEEASKPSYVPGTVHIPVSGCDTLQTDLVISYGTQSFLKVGDVYITMNSTDLYFVVKPYSGLKIIELAYFEAPGLEGIPVDKNGTPEPGKFSYKENWATGKSSHTFSIPLSEIEACEAHSLYLQLGNLNPSNSLSWSAWAWGHDMGDGYVMELCVPGCGSGIIQQL